MTDSESDLEEEMAELDEKLTWKPTLEEQKNDENLTKFILNLIKYQNDPKILAEIWNSLKVKL